MKKSFTLLELLIVIIIIGILSTLGITHYAGIREQALDKEAVANLRLIVAADKIHRMETGTWFVSENIGALNQNLKLSLPAGNSRNWNYATRDIAQGANCAEAARTGGNGRMWGLHEACEAPVPMNPGSRCSDLRGCHG